jgi:hypothetical protein
MAAVMKYYIGPNLAKTDPQRGFWVNIFRSLYFSYTASETDVIIFAMMVYADAEIGSPLSK